MSKSLREKQEDIKKKFEQPDLDKIPKWQAKSILQRTQTIPRTWLTYNQSSSDWEKNILSSMTVPGMEMSVDEMLKRHMSGLPLDASKGQLYKEGDEPLQNMDHMDEIDRAAYIDSVADQLVSIKERLRAEATTKAQKDFMKKVDDEVNQRIQKLREQQSEKPETLLE